ncbi:MAG TPA: double zinc ribbon domain-containing protein, partial [Dehalococcoidales bacterium]|nr:double zinc ribbon domain-containing protein [Dehalococcoidales bacterium]
GDLVCGTCQKILTPIVNPVCPRCGRPQASSILCPTCVTWTPSFECIRSPLRFEGLTRQIIHQFKYKNLRALAEPLGLILQNFLQHTPLPVEVVVPVPLHPRRLKERGYNQSSLLAKEISRRMNLSMLDDEVKRVKYVIPQAQTRSLSERHGNVKGAFICERFSSPGRPVLLIDDVATSGATLDACSEVLKQAGSGPVYALALAREI